MSKVIVIIPEGYEPDPFWMERAKGQATIVRDPIEAVANAHVITTDVWTSMGFEKEKNERKADFIGWQVNKKIMNLAKRNAIFMHCLPAHRREEVTAEVIDGERSVVWDEAENRLHTQKALMEFLLIGQVNR